MPWWLTLVVVVLGVGLVATSAYATWQALNCVDAYFRRTGNRDAVARRGPTKPPTQWQGG